MIEMGDYVHVDFAPVRGREQGGTRPALVLSTADFHSVSELAIVCPVTSNEGAWPYKVFLPASEPVAGAILVDQIRSVHRPSRGFRKLGAANSGVLEQVKTILGGLLLIDPAA